MVKNNNLLNRQKLFCGINKNSLFDSFDVSDLSQNKLFKYFFKPQKKQLKLAVKKHLNIITVT